MRPRDTIRDRKLAAINMRGWGVVLCGALCGASLCIAVGVAAEESVQQSSLLASPPAQAERESHAESTLALSAQELRPARSDLWPVPFVDLSKLEAAVASQLADAQRSLASLASQDEVPDAQLSLAFGTMGQLYHAYELFASAQACYKNASQLAPDEFSWIYILARLYQRQGQLELAIETYERARTLKPDNLACLVNLGNAYLEQNQAERAQALFERAVKQNAKCAAAHAGLGQAAFVLEQYADAVQHFKTALQLVPGANRLHYPLAMAYRQLRDEDRARSHLEQRGTVGIKVADPLIAEVESLVRGARLQLVRGKLAFQAGRYSEAVAAFNAAIQADPNTVAAWVNLGTSFIQLKQPHAAIAQFQAALRLQPDNLTAHYNLGVLLLSSGKSVEALRHLRTTVILNTQDQQAHFHLGSALLQLGHEEEALVHYAIAADLDPRDEVALGWTAELLNRQGHSRAARIRLEDTFRRFPSRVNTAHALARLLAASPDPTVRDGQRALALVTQVYTAKKTSPYAETMAMALAEVGRCEEASQWQHELVAEAEKKGDAAQIRRLQTILKVYERGSPCRLPTRALPSVAGTVQAIEGEDKGGVPDPELIVPLTPQGAGS